MTRGGLRPAIGLTALAAIGLCACQGADPCANAAALTPLAEGPTPLGRDPWEIADPATVGFDPVALDAAGTYSESIGGRCLLVYRDGKLVYERYANGASETSLQKSWSIAKSVTSTLTGIALGRRQLSCVEQPVADLVPEWRDGRRDTIQIRHLLSHTSGLAFDAIDDATFAIATGDLTAEALRTEVAVAPGTAFAYSQRAVQVLNPVLTRAIGEDLEAYARRHLWDVLGASPSLSWDRDGVGNVPTFEGLRVTCRDMLRFGLLELQEGTWNGKPVVPPEFRRAHVCPGLRAGLASRRPSGSMRAAHRSGWSGRERERRRWFSCMGSASRSSPGVLFSTSLPAIIGWWPSTSPGSRGAISPTPATRSKPKPPGSPTSSTDGPMGPSSWWVIRWGGNSRPR